MTPEHKVLVTDAQIEHMVQQFLRWKLPEDFAPDGGISFTKVSNVATPYEHRYEPVGTNLFDYTEAKAMVQHMVEGLPAIGACGQAVAEPERLMSEIASWEAGLELGLTIGQAKDLVSRILSTLSQPHPADERVVEAAREIAARAYIAVGNPAVAKLMRAGSADHMPGFIAALEALRKPLTGGRP